jgi:hypothetical protein
MLCLEVPRKARRHQLISRFTPHVCRMTTPLQYAAPRADYRPVSIAFSNVKCQVDSEQANIVVLSICRKPSWCITSSSKNRRYQIASTRRKLTCKKEIIKVSKTSNSVIFQNEYPKSSSVPALQICSGVAFRLLKLCTDPAQIACDRFHLESHLHRGRHRFPLLVCVVNGPHRQRLHGHRFGAKMSPCPPDVQCKNMCAVWDADAAERGADRTSSPPGMERSCIAVSLKEQQGGAERAGDSQGLFVVWQRQGTGMGWEVE